MSKVLLAFLAVFAAINSYGQNCNNNCFVFDFPTIEDNGGSTVKFTFCITTLCRHDLSYAAFELPPAQSAMSPANNGTYRSSKYNYKVENATNNPFNSIKFEAEGVDGYKNGVKDCFAFTVSRTVYNLMMTKRFLNVQAKASTLVGGTVFDLVSKTVSVACSPLPVDISAFTAIRKREMVELKWETQNEQNNQGFVIERNVNGSWKWVATVPSKAIGGTSDIKLNYSYQDQNNTTGISQYRLGQLEANGSMRYTQVRMVTGQGFAKSFILYPNPSQDGQVKLLFNEPSIREVIVSDAVGQVVKQYSKITENNFLINDLKSGFYTIKVVDKNSGLVSTEKLIVK